MSKCSYWPDRYWLNRHWPDLRIVSPLLLSASYFAIVCSKYFWQWSTSVQVCFTWLLNHMLYLKLRRKLLLLRAEKIQKMTTLLIENSKWVIQNWPSFSLIFCNGILNWCAIFNVFSWSNLAFLAFLAFGLWS